MVDISEETKQDLLQAAKELQQKEKPKIMISCPWYGFGFMAPTGQKRADIKAAQTLQVMAPRHMTFACREHGCKMWHHKVKECKISLACDAIMLYVGMKVNEKSPITKEMVDAYLEGQGQRPQPRVVGGEEEK